MGEENTGKGVRKTLRKVIVDDKDVMVWVYEVALRSKWPVQTALYKKVCRLR